MARESVEELGANVLLQNRHPVGALSRQRWPASSQVKNFFMMTVLFLCCSAKPLFSKQFSIHWSFEFASIVDQILLTRNNEILVLSNEGHSYDLFSESGQLIAKNKEIKRTSSVIDVGHRQALLCHSNDNYSLHDMHLHKSIWQKKFSVDINKNSLIGIANGKLIARSYPPGRISALDLKNACEIWRSYLHCLPRAHFIHRDKILLLTTNEFDSCLHVCSVDFDGKLLWKNKLDSAWSSCHIYETKLGVLVQWSGLPAFCLLNYEDGHLISRFELDGTSCSKPVIFDTDIVFRYNFEQVEILSSVNFLTAIENWCRLANYDKENNYGPMMLIRIGNFIALEGQCLIAFSPSTGEEQWLFKSNSDFFGPFFHDGLIWLNLNDRRLCAYNRKMSDKVAEFSGGERIDVQAVFDKKVIVLIDNKKLACIGSVCPFQK